MVWANLSRKELKSSVLTTDGDATVVGGDVEEEAGGRRDWNMVGVVPYFAAAWITVKS